MINTMEKRSILIAREVEIEAEEIRLLKAGDSPWEAAEKAVKIVSERWGKKQEDNDGKRLSARSQ